MDMMPAPGGRRLHIAPHAPRARSLVTPRRALLALFYALVFPFYWWTAVSSRNIHVRDFYNEFTDSILAGHLDMPYRPPKGLVALSNPYDPTLNAPYQRLYHDLILWHGHFYIGWGTTPVFTLFLPWRVLGVGDMPESVAAVIFSCVGLFFAVLLFLTLLDRFLPGTSLLKTMVAVTALAFCSVIPFILRRPAVYEVEISSGYAFMMLALYLLASGCLRRRLIAWRLGLGSLCLGLAFGGRPVLTPVALLAALLTFAVIMRNGANRHLNPVIRYGALVFGPMGVLGCLALAYNHVRFGSPLQYGLSYAISGSYIRNLHLFNFSYMVPSLTYILINPIYFSLSFPYVALSPQLLPVTLPPGYIVESVAGILVTTPFLLFAAGIPFVGQRDRASREFRTALYAMAGLGLLSLLLVAFTIWGVTQEVEVDYVTLLLVPALLVWCALTRGRGWQRSVTRVIGAAAILYASLIGFAVSFSGYYDALLQNNAGEFWTLERLTSFIPTTITELVGHPDLVRVYYIGGGGTFQPTLTGARVIAVPLHVSVVAPDSSWQLRMVLRPKLPANGTVDVTVSYQNTERHVVVGGNATVIVVPLESGVDRIRLSAPTGEAATIVTSNFARKS